MKRQKKKQNGITLIALVISIIVMLILAGVSINALTGDNGILRQAMNASWLSEMTAVQEAFELWKTQHYDDDLIPSNGSAQKNDIENNGRIYGEIAYYRRWSQSATKEMPQEDVTSNLNSIYNGDIVYMPRGVEDLYYLDNDGIGIKGNKKYIIDATNSMIYAVNGYTVNGISVHSLAMFKALNDNIYTAPAFAEAGVNGSGNNIIYAGAKYYMDKDGNYVDENGNIVTEENKVENPNGFEIIASDYSNNIYKLYNNGDLYAKGIKGTQILTLEDDMSENDTSQWTQLSVPAEIGEYKKIISGTNVIYVIDSNDYLWAWGNGNYTNKLGLTSLEEIDYTGREAVKLDVKGHKVKDVFDAYNALFVLTKDNELYARGDNSRYQLGLGHANAVTDFELVDIPNPENIKYIINACETGFWAIAVYKDGTYRGTGSEMGYHTGSGTGGSYKYFLPVFNGIQYDETSTPDNLVIKKEYNEDLDIQAKIKKIAACDARGISFLFNDGTLWYAGSHYYFRDNTEVALTQLPTTYSTNVKDIYNIGYGILILKENGDVYAINGITNNFGYGSTSNTVVKLTLPTELQKGNKTGIKEVYTMKDTIYYLSVNNKLYGSSSVANNLGKKAFTNGIVEIKNAPELSTLYTVNDKYKKVNEAATYLTTGAFVFGNDKELYSIGNATILYRNNILEQNWRKIATDVKQVALGQDSSIAIVDKDKNLYVAGDDSRFLGLNTSVAENISELTQVDNSLINNHVKLVKFNAGDMYVLTTGGKLYCTGLFSSDGTTLGWNKEYDPGWDEVECKYTLYELDLDKVSDFAYSGERDKVAIADGKLYYWGFDYSYSMPTHEKTPTEWKNLPSTLKIGDIKKFINTSQSTEIITTDGKLFTFGTTNTANPLYLPQSSWTDMTSTWFGTEKIIDIVAVRGTNVYYLTDSGNVYGRGFKRYLGKNITDTQQTTNIPVKLDISNITQIAAGNNFFIMIDSTGKVFGTGDNTYGALGRWRDVSRNSPNSRYKTAFTVVECPELEQ